MKLATGEVDSQGIFLGLDETGEKTGTSTVSPSV